MIYTLKINCIAGRFLEGEWIRIIEISGDSGIFTLGNFIHRTIGFDDDHLSDFYAGRNYHNRKIEFDVDVKIKEIYPLPRLKLYYYYDYGDSWIFEITKTRKKLKDEEIDVVYPRVVEVIGENPNQYGSY